MDCYVWISEMNIRLSEYLKPYQQLCNSNDYLRVRHVKAGQDVSCYIKTPSVSIPF